MVLVPKVLRATQSYFLGPIYRSIHRWILPDLPYPIRQPWLLSVEESIFPLMRYYKNRNEYLPISLPNPFPPSSHSTTPEISNATVFPFKFTR